MSREGAISDNERREATAMDDRRTNIDRIMRIFSVQPNDQVIVRSPMLEPYIDGDHDPYRFLRIDQYVEGGKLGFVFTMHEFQWDIPIASDEALEMSLGAGGWPSEVRIAVMVADLEYGNFIDIAWHSSLNKIGSIEDYE